jgi:hypothetical protein
VLAAVRPVLRRVPAITASPIRVRFLPALTVWRGKLHSEQPGGVLVHAASFPRRRELVLDTALLGNASELARIVVHELFHFAWPRLGNPARRSYEELLQHEFRLRARGELGWPAQMVKVSLSQGDLDFRTRRWREYVCESFCDTAAFIYAGLRGHAEWTLAKRHRSSRAIWFRALSGEGPLVL